MKPAFVMAENEAGLFSVTNSEQKTIAKETRRSENAQLQVLCKLSSISYAFSFPLCDLLICEFPEFVTNSEQMEKKGHTEPTVTSVTSNFAVRKVSRVAHYIYQKVVRRKAVPYIPSPKNPKYLLYHVEETLECGHVVTIHPSEGETLTARKRNCHECSGWFGGLRLPEGKKANASIFRSYERIKKQAGESFWPLTFAAACMIAFGFFLHSLRETGYTYSAPENKFRVLEQINDYDFVLQRVENGLALPPAEFRFCHDYQPMFSTGMTLTYFSYVDRGKCFSVAPKDRWYVIERDENHMPTLAPNCTPDFAHDRYACDGKPKF